MKRRLSLMRLKCKIPFILFASFLPICSFAQRDSVNTLFVGANYHPHDLRPDQWLTDISLMKAAGFKVVRMGHLAWDSFEPSEGEFRFNWFDIVMDKMHAAGIRVILDIALRPAPLWLHYKFPGADITDADGNRLYSNSRYMEDIGDTSYQRLVMQFADTLTKHFASHPALLAFGIDNEAGDGFFSYSENVRRRFVEYIKNRYQTIDSLNKVWATQRWSRRINQWDEIGLPVSGEIIGAPERMLDMKRFFSDETIGLYHKIKTITAKNAPGVINTSNIWCSFGAGRPYDYAKISYSEYHLERAGFGFYPGSSLTDLNGLKRSCLVQSLDQFESNAPFWDVEFNTHESAPKSIRRNAYTSLLYGSQVFCGWTWQSMNSGEEQYLQGMIDWDGKPNRKYEEYKQIASEFTKIMQYGFPRRLSPEVALAYSYESQAVSNVFPETHERQLYTSASLFFDQNMDYKVADLRFSQLPYKLLIISGVALMDSMSAAHIRNFVQGGGTVLMTANSAIVNANNQVFTTTHPGLLNDVFGIRVGGFEKTHVIKQLTQQQLQSDSLKIRIYNTDLSTTSEQFELIETSSASVVASIRSLEKVYPLITMNRFGKGRAFYIGIPSRENILKILLEKFIKDGIVKPGFPAPSNVLARKIDRSHILYFNLNKTPAQIQFTGSARSILHNKEYKGKFTIPAFEPEFIELNRH